MFKCERKGPKITKMQKFPLTYKNGTKTTNTAWNHEENVSFKKNTKPTQKLQKKIVKMVEKCKKRVNHKKNEPKSEKMRWKKSESCAKKKREKNAQKMGLLEKSKKFAKKSETMRKRISPWYTISPAM